MNIVRYDPFGELRSLQDDVNRLCESRVENNRQARNDKIFLLMDNQLIQIYLLVCQIYDSHSSLKFQRLSNFKPKFSDEEIITVYLLGQLNERFNCSADL